MKKPIGVGLLFCLLASAGCETMQSGTASNYATAEEAVAASGLEASGGTLGALRDAAIPGEACGMILWTLNSQRPTPVFRYISGKQGEINLAGELIKLDLINVAGVSGFGVFEEQVFRNKDGIQLDIAAQFGVGFDGGAYLESGLIKINDPAGWSVVTPAAGIAGCR